VLPVTRLEDGHSQNVLPPEVAITGTMHSFDSASPDRIEAAVRAIAADVALTSGTEVELRYMHYSPAILKTPAQAELALEAAHTIGLRSSSTPRPAVTSKDFADMLQRCSGAYLSLGQGRTDAHADGKAPLHHMRYDFNNEALPLSVRWFCEVAERVLRPKSTRVG
jgi:hippurate hydrolase